MPPCRLSPHEEWVVARADYWTAVAFRGHPEGYERVECASRAEAIEAARGLATDRGAMVYAVHRTHQALTDTV